MKKFLSLVLTVLFTAVFTVTAYAAEAVPKKVLKQTDSVVRIISEYKSEIGSGTGFVIKNDSEGTFIVTNNHVVEGNPESIVIFFDEEIIYAEVVARSSQKDMAVLKLEYRISAEPLKPASKSAQRGDAVYAAGFPGASDNLSDAMNYRSEDVTITDGIVSAVREFTMSSYGTSSKMLQINAAINSGNSGGPLFNEKGEVIGINTLGVGESQGVFAAIDISELKTFLDNSGIKLRNFNFDMLYASAAVLLAAVFVLKLKKDREKAKQLVPEHKRKPEEDIIEISVKTDNRKVTLKFPELKLPELNTKKIVITAIAFIFVAAAGLHIGTIAYAKSENFVDAKNVIVLPTVKYIDTQLYQYMVAAKQMTDGEFDAAKENFEAMSGYLYADNMVYETEYRKAARRVDNDDFASAVTIYRNLSREGYKDSAQKLMETKYRQGMYMYEKGNYDSALKVLGELLGEYEQAAYAFAEIQALYIAELTDENNFLKAYEVAMLAPEYVGEEGISLIKEGVYLSGQIWYFEKSYDNARGCFEVISDYKDSEKYLKIIDILDFFNFTPYEERVAYLIEIFDFENVPEIILSEQSLAEEFLKGRWETTDRQYHMYIAEDGYMTNGMPMLKGYENCYYYIENGEYRVYHNNPEDYKVSMVITALTTDSIKIYCAADNNTYTLYRK
ncbi:MAG: trypsin-like peptidase domain-containing protein [Oscillospiraceae bacterium]|nr:trypsin-like peptidase domain-containing protein [Oscillospiraceae bacterium]